MPSIALALTLVVSLGSANRVPEGLPAPAPTDEEAERSPSAEAGPPAQTEKEDEWGVPTFLLAGASAEGALGLSIGAGLAVAYLYTAAQPIWSLDLGGLYWGGAFAITASTALMPLVVWLTARASGFQTSYWAGLAGAVAGHLLAIGTGMLAGPLGYGIAVLILPAAATTVAAWLASSPRSGSERQSPAEPRVDPTWHAGQAMHAGATPNERSGITVVFAQF